jgi:hypothetical protein
MSTDSRIYNRARQYFDTGDATLTGPLKIALLNGYTPDLETHHTWPDVSAHEITADSYTPGGQPLQSPTLTRSGPTTTWTAQPATWPALTTTLTHAVIYQNDPTQELIGLMALNCGGDPISLHVQNLRINILATINVAQGA